MTLTYMGMLLKSGRVRPTYWTPHSGAGNLSERQSVSESHSALSLSDSAFCAGSRQSRSATRSIPASSRACATWSAVSLGNPAPAREGAVQLRQQGGAEEPWPERANGQRPPIPEREGGKPCTGRALVHDQRLGRSDRGSSLYGCGRNGSCSATNPARRKTEGVCCPRRCPPAKIEARARLRKRRNPAVAGASPSASERIRTSDLGSTGR